jgi:hypothetical protein
MIRNAIPLILISSLLMGCTPTKSFVGRIMVLKKAIL